MPIIIMRLFGYKKTLHTKLHNYFRKYKVKCTTNKRKFITQDIFKYYNNLDSDFIKIASEKSIDFFILDYPLKKKFKNFYDICKKRYD